MHKIRTKVVMTALVLILCGTEYTQTNDMLEAPMSMRRKENMTRPQAVVTIRFDSPLTDSEIAEAVEKAVLVESRGALVKNAFYADGDAVELGVKSGYPYEQLKVVPEDDYDGVFMLEGRYEAVQVVSHDWSGSVYAIGHGDYAAIKAVKAFAKVLDNVVNG